MFDLSEISSGSTLSEKTYIALKKAIIGLELKPGQLISVEEISEELGVSRTPIRTALNSLTNDGLVEIIPGKGSFVKELSEKDVTDLLNIRQLLEAYAIKLAAKLRTQEDLDELEFIISKTEFIYGTKLKDKSEFLTYDEEFHDKIAKICNNPYIEQQLSMINVNNRRYLNATTFEQEMPYAIEEHKIMLEQIRKQDSEKAETYMKEHIDNIKIRMIDNIKLKEDS